MHYGYAMLYSEHLMNFEKTLSCSPDLHETRTDTRIPRTRETGYTNMAAKFSERDIEPLQLRRTGRRVT